MQPKLKRVYLPKIRTFVVLALCAALVFAAVKVTLWSTHLMRQTGLSPGFFFRLLFDQGATLRERDGRTNLLVLGIAGGDHAGSDLTDTMIIASVDTTRRALTLISLPRDLWSETLQDKINSAYHYGEEKSGKAGSGSGEKDGGGLLLAKVIAEEISGLPIHYGVVVDFSGFRRVIDLLGGVTVRVPQPFTDPQFPIEGKEDDVCGGDPVLACRYESLRFDAGEQVMDGQRALQYVRSRHAEGEEGSDFARSRRQQDILVAMKERILSVRFFTNPLGVWRLVQEVDAATTTDMTIGEIATIGKLLTRIPDSQTQRISIEELLWSPPLFWYGRYVLVPKENFEEIQKFVLGKLD